MRGMPAAKAALERDRSRGIRLPQYGSQHVFLHVPKLLGREDKCQRTPLHRRQAYFAESFQSASAQLLPLLM